MSDVPTPAMASARGADSAAAVVVTSSACEIAFHQVAAAAPRTGTGGRGPWRARSARVMTIAAAPSVTRQQSRSEEHTSELQSLMRNSYAVFCLKKKKL